MKKDELYATGLFLFTLVCNALLLWMAIFSDYLHYAWSALFFILVMLAGVKNDRILGEIEFYFSPHEKAGIITLVVVYLNLALSVFVFSLTTLLTIIF